MQYIPGLNQTVSWETRVNVAIGVARGLSFLHDTELAVHGDVKASSILLDGDFSAKLSGFTLSKLGPTCYSPPPNYATVRYPQYTYKSGYTPPEYIYAGELTAEYDVYSFGVVMLELLGGRPALDPKEVGRARYLVEWARPYLSDKRKFLQIMDTRLDRKYPRKGAFTISTLALQCLTSEPKQRSCITKILVALEQLKGPKTGI